MKVIKRNPTYFKEVDCKEGGCRFFWMEKGKSFCRASRIQRRKMKCFKKIKGNI